MIEKHEEQEEESEFDEDIYFEGMTVDKLTGLCRTPGVY